MLIGERLKALRKSAKQTQEEVANSIGVSRAVYSHFENNRNEPDIEIIRKLSDHFQVSTDYILDNEIPGWASQSDVIELQELLENNVNMAYGGESLTEAEKQRVKDILTTLFWDKLQKKKEGGGDGKQN